MTTTNVVIPVSEPEIVEPKGTPEGIDAFATVLYSAASRYEEFGEVASQLVMVPLWWSGPASQAYGKAARRASDEHTTLASTLRRVAHACSGHADTLTDLLREHRRLVDTKQALDDRRTQLITDVAAAQDVEQSVINELQDRARVLTGDYRTLVLDHDALQRKVRSNEGVVRSAFNRTDTLDEILAAGGNSDPIAKDAMNRPGAPGTGASPQDVENWWSNLTAAEKEAVIAAHPRLIGRTDGLPADARDQANRIAIADDLDRLSQKEDDGTLSPEETKKLANARAARDALEKGDKYVDPTTGERPGTQLWLYAPGAFDGDGKIAISLGDLDTAKDVAIRVPGIETDASGAPGLMAGAVNVYQSAVYNGDGSSVASMMWLGYDAPDGPTDRATLTEGRAEDGGDDFADAIDGLRASRPNDAAHLTAIGHSYGSTTLAHAATDHGIDVDDIVLVGSPGAGGGVDHASDLGVDADHVYVGRNSGDIVAALGDHGSVGAATLFGMGLGNDPSEDDFGATRFEAEDPTRSSWQRGTDQHGRYFDPDSESLYNIGRVVDGSGHVNPADHTSDPFLSGPKDPEIDRQPTTDEPGRSDTTRSRR